MYSPKAGKGKTAENGGENLIFYGEGTARAEQADDQPDPPGLFSPVIFYFDDSRMADADAQKYGCTNDDSAIIHSGRKVGEKDQGIFS